MVEISKLKKGVKMKSAASIAKKNINAIEAKNRDRGRDGMSFTRPNPSIGYGQLLVAIATLPKANRISSLFFFSVIIILLSII